LGFALAIVVGHATTQRMIRKVLKPVWIFLALLFLLEAWLWDLLVPPIRALIGITATD
jgi:small-conductance mechanosensitive channel